MSFRELLDMYQKSPRLFQLADKLSFAQKRKTLWNNLRGQYAPEDLKRAMTKAKIEPAIRAEALTLEESASLFRELALAEARSERA